MDGGAERRRRVCAAVCRLPAASGHSGDDHGVCHRPGGPGEPRADVSDPDPREAGMASPRLCGLLRQHLPHGVLHRGHGLDDALCGFLPAGPLREPQLRRDDVQPRPLRGVYALCRGAGLLHPHLPAPKGAGGRHKGDALRPARADGGAGGESRDASRRGGGASVLPGSGPSQNHPRRDRGRHEPGVLHAVHRHRRHRHLRQLHRQEPHPHGRKPPRHPAGHLCRRRGGPHHLPRLRHLRHGGDRRALPAV